MVLGNVVVGWIGETSFLLARRAVAQALMRMECGRGLRILAMDFAVWHAMMMLTAGRFDRHAPAMNFMALTVSP